MLDADKQQVVAELFTRAKSASDAADVISNLQSLGIILAADQRLISEDVVLDLLRLFNYFPTRDDAAEKLQSRQIRSAICALIAALANMNPNTGKFEIDTLANWMSSIGNHARRKEILMHYASAFETIVKYVPNPELAAHAADALVRNMKTPDDDLLVVALFTDLRCKRPAEVSIHWAMTPVDFSSLVTKSLIKQSSALRQNWTKEKYLIYSNSEQAHFFRSLGVFVKESPEARTPEMAQELIQVIEAIRDKESRICRDAASALAIITSESPRSISAIQAGRVNFALEFSNENIRAVRALQAENVTPDSTPQPGPVEPVRNMNALIHQLLLESTPPNKLLMN